jgi:hypothetical protein
MLCIMMPSGTTKEVQRPVVSSDHGTRRGGPVQCRERLRLCVTIEKPRELDVSGGAGCLMARHTVPRLIIVLR